MSEYFEVPPPPRLSVYEQNSWYDLYQVCSEVLASERDAHKAFEDTVRRESDGRPIQYVNRDMQRHFERLCRRAIIAQKVPMISKYALQTLTDRICTDWLKADLDEWNIRVRKPCEYGEWS